MLPKKLLDTCTKHLASMTRILAEDIRNDLPRVNEETDMMQDTYETLEKFDDESIAAIIGFSKDEIRKALRVTTNQYVWDTLFPDESESSDESGPPDEESPGDHIKISTIL